MGISKSYGKTASVFSYDDGTLLHYDAETGEWSVIYHTTVAEGALYTPPEW